MSAFAGLADAIALSPEQAAKSWEVFELIEEHIKKKLCWRWSLRCRSGYLDCPRIRITGTLPRKTAIRFNSDIDITVAFSGRFDLLALLSEDMHIGGAMRTLGVPFFLGSILMELTRHMETLDGFQYEGVILPGCGVSNGRGMARLMQDGWRKAHGTFLAGFQETMFADGIKCVVRGVCVDIVVALDDLNQEFFSSLPDDIRLMNLHGQFNDGSCTVHWTPALWKRPARRAGGLSGIHVKQLEPSLRASGLFQAMDSFVPEDWADSYRSAICILKFWKHLLPGPSAGREIWPRESTHQEEDMPPPMTSFYINCFVTALVLREVSRGVAAPHSPYTICLLFWRFVASLDKAIVIHIDFEAADVISVMPEAGVGKRNFVSFAHPLEHTVSSIEETFPHMAFDVGICNARCTLLLCNDFEDRVLHAICAGTGKFREDVGWTDSDRQLVKLNWHLKDVGSTVCRSCSSEEFDELFRCVLHNRGLLMIAHTCQFYQFVSLCWDGGTEITSDAIDPEAGSRAYNMGSVCSLSFRCIDVFEPMRPIACNMWRPGNVESLLGLGALVQVHSLVASPDLNGKTGIIVAWQNGRLGMLFDDVNVGSKAIKRANLQVLAPPQSDWSRRLRMRELKDSIRRHDQLAVELAAAAEEMEALLAPYDPTVVSDIRSLYNPAMPADIWMTGKSLKKVKERQAEIAQTLTDLQAKLENM